MFTFLEDGKTPQVELTRRRRTPSRTSILTFAGVERIAARSIVPEDFATAGKATRKFALGDDGISAAVVAADYLRSQLGSVSNVTPFFAPWAIYIATVSHEQCLGVSQRQNALKLECTPLQLVLWTVTALRPSPPRPATVDGSSPVNPDAVRVFVRMHNPGLPSADFWSVTLPARPSTSANLSPIVVRTRCDKSTATRLFQACAVPLGTQ